VSKVFAANLRAYRELARMSQQDLAFVTGITRNTIANYETGRSEPDFEKLCVIARALGADITDLVTEHSGIPDRVHRVLVSDDEMFLLDIYRKANATYRNVAIDILRAHQEDN